MSTEAALRLGNALLEAGARAEDRAAVCAGSADSVLTPPCRPEADEDLLASVNRGSREALSTLFLRHGRAVLHIAWRILRDDAEAADLRQEVFISVFQNARNFDSAKGSASSWIMQIAYRRAIDRRRYLANRQHYDAAVFDEYHSQVGNPPLSTDAIDGKAIRNRLRETLSVDQRETLELHLFEGYSLREIAEKNGQSLGNVRHHYYRALERLRSQVFARKRE